MPTTRPDCADAAGDRGLFPAPGGFGGSSVRLTTTWVLIRQCEKGCDGPAQTFDVLFSQTADLVAKPVLSDGENLVHHDAGAGLQSVLRRRLYDDAKEGKVGWIAGESTYRDGLQGAKMIVLNNDDGSRLSRVPTIAGSRPDLASFQSGIPGEMASAQA